jgi:chemotaxis protein MotA
MDIATLLGIAVAAALVVSSVALSGGSYTAFLDLPSAMIVFGGALAAALVSFPLRNIANTFRVFFKSIFYRLESIPKLQRELVNLSEFARRNGLLALESQLPKVRNPFLALALQLVVDNTRPEITEEILRCEIAAAANRHRDGKAVFECMGRFAPAFGMIGTLLGLVMMLGNMRDPTKIGSGMAVALLTTLYGAVAANVFFLPIAAKLKYTSQQELIVMDMILKAVLDIQAGEHPRMIEHKAKIYYPDRSLREEREERRAA